VLELGFAHGVSTCYLASAVDAGPHGRVVSIDLESARKRDPSAEALVARCGLSDVVELHYEPTSYTWRLMRFLEETPRRRFDFCFIDGAHSWFVDGFAFLLVDRLLAPSGWVVFDDLDWTYELSPTLKDTEFVRSMPDDERTTPQVRKIYELLVKTHPGYANFRTHDGWAYAQKVEAGAEAVVRNSGRFALRSAVDRLRSILGA
jgi:predicted O-methyltransferase YrrM